jgi:hypothetical protein
MRVRQDVKTEQKREGKANDEEKEWNSVYCFPSFYGGEPHGSKTPVTGAPAQGRAEKTARDCKMGKRKGTPQAQNLFDLYDLHHLSGLYHG